MTLPSILVVVATAVFLVVERLYPGRDLPKARGWYLRALLVNAAQLGITLVTAKAHLANLRTPRWLRYVIQTPELHSIHHQYGVHRYNFSDIPIWDRLFKTYRDTTEFAARCGFHSGAEEQLVAVLLFKDVYRRQRRQTKAERT